MPSLRSIDSIRDALRETSGAATLLVAIGVLTSAALAGGCAGGGQLSELQPAPRAPTPRAAAPAAEERAEPPAQSPAPPAPATDPAAPPEIMVVIESGDDDRATPRTMVELAERERQRRATAGPPIAVITDRNLSEHATGKLTFVEESPEEEGEELAVAEVTAELEALADQETYWRQTVLDVRTRWRDAVDAVERLEVEVVGLRRRFYAEDDPHYRDTQVKPAWDRALDLLAAAREAVAGARDELATVIERGRREGALPGWLREGVDLEPEPLDLPPSPRDRSDRIYEPEEPVILEEYDDGDGGAR